MTTNVLGSRLNRLAPATGILFVVLIFAGFFGPMAPKAPDSGATIVASFADHRTGWLVKLYVESVGWMLFLWFLGSVAAALRRAGELRLAAVAFAGGTVTVALIALGYAVQAALAFDVARVAGASTSKAIYDLSFMAFVWSAFPAAVLLGSTAVASLRTRALPAWYAWATAAAAAWTLLGGAAFAQSGFFAPDESGTVTSLRYMFFLLWALVTATLLLRRGGDAESPQVEHPNSLRPAATVGALLLAGLLLATPAASAQELQLTRQFGASGFDVARAIGADETGVYAFGAVSGALPGQAFAGGPDDVYLRKYDQAGNELWTRQFGTAGDDFSMAGPVAIDESAVYVAGWTDGALPGETNAGNYDAFVRRYDTDGNELWTDQFGAAGYDDIDGIAVYGSAIFVAGSTLSALPGQTSGGSWDGHVRRYDSDGNAIWTRQFGGAGSEDHHGIAADKTGVYVAGSITTGPDFTGDDDVLLLKYDFAGNLLWVRQFGTAGFDHSEAVAERHGEIYVVGYVGGALPGQTSAGGADVFVRKYDPDGNEVWTRQFGSAGNDSASFRGVATDGRGVYITGNVNGTLPGQTRAGGRDGFVRQYSHAGDELWTLQFGTGGDDRAIAVAVGENDDVYLGGRTSGAFPGFTYAGGTDAFVTKILKGE